MHSTSVLNTMVEFGEWAELPPSERTVIIDQLKRRSASAELQLILLSEPIPLLRQRIARALAEMTQSDDSVSIEQSVLPPPDSDTLNTVVAMALTILHELRNDLAAVRSAIRQAPGETTEYTTAALAGMQESLEGIEALTLVGPSNALDRTSFSLYSFVETCADAERHRQPEVEIKFDGPEHLQTTGVTQLLGLALRNGIRNALEASSSALRRKVTISFGNGPAGSWIAVFDQGAGFEHDFLVSTAANIGGGGQHLGIGLWIVRAAMFRHGGVAKLERLREGAGSVFRLEWT